MNEFKDEMSNNQITLFVLNKEKYADLRKELLKAMVDCFKKICYITTNKPYNSLVDELEKANLSTENIFFIDTITKTVKTPQQSSNCIFIDSPTSLTDISLGFSDAMNEKQCDICILDTVSTLTIYQDSSLVIKLVHNLITKIRVIGKHAIFVALKEDGEEFINDISMFADKVIRLG
ncbi:hypothetical protein JXA85_04615 [Candidatus Woesearchaeota archaeon]|nr:hypothetical protein [Candidatus Woesearchaeota archaeon]